VLGVFGVGVDDDAEAHIIEGNDTSDKQNVDLGEFTHFL
jgi:hypothetical protein